MKQSEAMSLREAEAARDLLLDRLMTVNSEVNGGSKIIQRRDGHEIEIHLSRKVARTGWFPVAFMGCRVTYKVTGWAHDK